MLGSGPAGDEIPKLRQRPMAAGCEPGEPDGAFGPKTEAAVKAFQANLEFDVDRICGPKTPEARSGVINALTAQWSPVVAADDDGPAPL